MSEQKELIETLLEQIQDLEDQMALLLVENDKLQRENSRLRRYSVKFASAEPAGHDPTPVPPDEGWDF